MARMNCSTSRLRPSRINHPVVRRAPLEVRCLAALWDTRRHLQDAFDCRKQVLDRLKHDPVVESLLGVERLNFNRLLQNDVAGITAGINVMVRIPGVCLLLHHRPGETAATSILWQQRGM